MHNADILALAGLRVDGRAPDDIRRIKFNLGVANDADGSAYYEQVHLFSATVWLFE
jgi:exosome complex component RRP41